MNNEILKWFQQRSNNEDNPTSHLLSGKSILKNALIREDNKFYLHYIVLIKKILKLHEYLEGKINETSVVGFKSSDLIDMIFESASKKYHETTDGLLEREKLRDNIKLIRSNERIEKNKAVDALEDEDRQLNDARVQYNLSAPRRDEDEEEYDNNIDNLEPVLSQDERDADNED